MFLAYWMVIGLIETRTDQTSSSILSRVEWPFYAPGVISILLYAAIAMAQSLDAAQGAGHGA